MRHPLHLGKKACDGSGTFYFSHIFITIWRFNIVVTCILALFLKENSSVYKQFLLNVCESHWHRLEISPTSNEWPRSTLWGDLRGTAVPSFYGGSPVNIMHRRFSRNKTEQHEDSSSIAHRRLKRHGIAVELWSPNAQPFSLFFWSANMVPNKSDATIWTRLGWHLIHLLQLAHKHSFTTTVSGLEWPVMNMKPNLLLRSSVSSEMGWHRLFVIQERITSYSSHGVFIISLSIPIIFLPIALCLLKRAYCP